MIDTELLAKRLEDVELELDKLRWQTMTLEIVFTALWTFAFRVSGGMSPQQSTSSLLGILATLQDMLGESLRRNADPEDERARRLEALAEVMEHQRVMFSALSEMPLP